MKSLDITQLDYSDSGFIASLDGMLVWEDSLNQQVETRVADIVRGVRQRGDAALIDYTQQFDAFSVDDFGALELSQQCLQQALESVPALQLAALKAAAGRIRDYHLKQRQDSWQYEEPDGTILGQQVTPVQRVGVYVPGGKAAYPSTVLMNVIPARVAGVEEIIMVVPAPSGELNDLVLAAASIAGVDRVFTIGGAQAVAALAYGTETVPRVDKIVGPGNIYVATAKRQVFGQVGIDMIAGPSEILVLCDGGAEPDWIAMDLFSQAEHDEQAQAILVATEQGILDAVAASMQRLLGEMERKDIIAQSINERGVFVLVDNLEQAVEVINHVAPEHLELAVEQPQALLPKIINAGAIFLGYHTPEAFGDYCAGPNHVLPTSGTARFSSPLGVYDFQKRSSIIGCSRQGAAKLGPVASQLARGEGLTAHARSAEYRIEK